MTGLGSRGGVGDADPPNAKRPGAAMKRCARPLAISGAGGSRTRVRLQIPRDLYVRISRFFSPRSLIGPEEAHREPAVRVSPAPSRRQTQASQILATPAGPPQAGLTGRREVRKPVRSLLTQPERSCRSQLLVSRRFYEVSEDLGTQPRLHHTRRNLDSPITRVVKYASNLPTTARPVNPLALQSLSSVFTRPRPGHDARFGPAGAPSERKRRASCDPEASQTVAVEHFGPRLAFTGCHTAGAALGGPAMTR
jgi:hypothetical protein